jgi:hypothetical protein
MDNYRHPMYTRYNRNMGAYHNTPCSPGVTPVVEAGMCDRCDKDHFDHCDKDHLENCIDKLPLAMAYVPFQKWRKVLDGAAGLEAGTIFQELIKPFYGDKNNCGMRGDRS